MPWSCALHACTLACGAFLRRAGRRAGFVTSPSWNAFLNCTCPIAGTGAGRRRALLTLDTLGLGTTPHQQATGVVTPSWDSASGGSGSWSDSSWGNSAGGAAQPGGFKFFGECGPRSRAPPGSGPQWARSLNDCAKMAPVDC